MIRKIRYLLKECNRDSINAYAAQSAFFTILSFIPFVMFFISMLRYTPVSKDLIEEGLKLMLPDYLEQIIIMVIDESYTKSFGIVSLSAIFAIWSAAKSIQYLSNGLNKIYSIKETRNWIILRIRAVIYTFLMLLSIVMLLTLMVFGHKLQESLIQYFPVLSKLTGIVLNLRSLIIFGVMILFFSLIYTALPNRKMDEFHRITYRSQLPGAVACSIAWYVFSYGLSVYVNYFHGFSTYGSMTTVVLIMFWLYDCMYIFMFCAEINHIYSEYLLHTVKKKWKLLQKGEFGKKA